MSARLLLDLLLLRWVTVELAVNDHGGGCDGAGNIVVTAVEDVDADDDEDVDISDRQDVAT